MGERRSEGVLKELGIIGGSLTVSHNVGCKTLIITHLSKFKISTKEAEEVMEIYYKLTGEKIKTADKLEQVYKVLREYLKKNASKLFV